MTAASLVHEISSYLTRHPEARDTVEGIAEWWLLRQQIHDQTAAVRAALEQLVLEDLVLERRGLDGRAFYQLNRSKLRQIHARLSGPAGTGD